MTETETCGLFAPCKSPSDGDGECDDMLAGIEHFELEQMVAGKHRCTSSVMNMYGGDLHEDQCILPDGHQRHHYHPDIS